MVANVLGKTHHRLTSKLLISFLGPKITKNASESQLYMNVKKMMLAFARKKNNISTSLLSSNQIIHCQEATSELPSVFASWGLLTIIGSRSPPSIYSFIHSSIHPSIYVDLSIYSGQCRTQRGLRGRFPPRSGHELYPPPPKKIK